MARWSNLMVALTTECTRACPNCCYHVGAEGGAGRSATWSELERFAVRVRETVDRVGWLYASGGEPTIHPDFGRVLREFKRMFNAERLCVQTNGAKILEYADQLSDVDRVRLTMFAGNDEVTAELQPLLGDRLIQRKAIHNEVVGHPGFTKACASQRPHTVTYWDGRVYRCCMGPGLAGAEWCSVDDMTVERVASLEMACSTCPFARSSAEIEFRELHEDGWTWSPPWPNEWWVGRARWVAERVSEWEDVLDLGCGRACLAGVLRASGHRGLYYGVDHNEELLDEACVGLNKAGIGDGVGTQLIDADLEHFDVSELLRKEWHYVGGTSLTAEPPVVVLSSVLERLDDPVRLVSSIPQGVRVVALVEQLIYARSSGKVSALVERYGALFNDFEVGTVVDCGEAIGLLPAAARGWAYGFTGVRR